MKKIFTIFLLVFIIFSASQVFAKPKKIKCEKPIYCFENIQKSVMFGYLDEAIQKKNYQLLKFYPELGFISIKYWTQKVNFNLKQFGNYVYLFIDINDTNSRLEKYIYKNLKNKTKNSYQITDNLFCSELSKDVKSINSKRKPYLKDSSFNPFEYNLSIKRYVGYEKKLFGKK